MAQFKPYDGEEITRQEYTSKFQPYKGEEVSREMNSFNQGFPEVDAQPTPFVSEEDIAAQRQDILDRQTSDINREKSGQEWLARQQQGGFGPMLDVPKAIGKGVINATNNAIETGAAVADTVTSAGAEALGVREPGTTGDLGLARNFRKAIPTLPDTDGQNPPMDMLQKGTEIGVGMLAGDKAATKLARKIPEGVSRLRTAGRLGAQEVGGVVTENPNDELIYYKDDLVNPDDPNYSNELLARKYKMTKEALTIAVLTGAAAKGITIPGTWAVDNLVKPVLNYQDKNVMKDKYVKEFMNIFKGITPDTPRDVINQKTAEGIKYVEDNADIFIKFGEGNNLEGVKHTQDTISAMIDSLDPKDPKEAAKIKVLEGFRSSALVGEAPGLRSKLEEPGVKLKDTVDEAFDKTGGNEAIENTKNTFQQQARDEVQPSLDQIDRTKAEISKVDKDFDTVAQTDEVFGPKIRQAGADSVNLDLNKDVIANKREIVDTANVDEQTAKKVVNDAYEAIPHETPARMDEFQSIIEEEGDFVPAGIKKLVENSDGTFYDLNNRIKPQVSKALSQAYRSNDAGAIDALNRLKKNIQEDQIAWLTENGNEATIRAAQEASAAYKKYGDVYNQGVNKELKVNAKVNRPIGTAEPVDLREKGVGIVEQTLKNPNRVDSQKQLKEAMTRQGKTDLLDDTLIGETISDWRAKVNTGKTGIKDINVDELAKPLRDATNALSEKGKQRVEVFLTSIRNKKLTLAELDTKLKKFEEAAENAKDEVYGSSLKEFFTKNGGKYDPKKSGYEIFDSMVKTEEQAARIPELLAKNTDPLVKEGMKAAWLRGSHQRLFGADVKNVKDMKNVGALSDGFMKAGEYLFGPEAMQGVKALRDLTVKGEKANVTRGIAGANAADPQNAMRTAIGTLSTWMFGVLNPTAARIKTVTSDLLRKHDPYDKAKLAIDEILSDPHEFVKIAKKMAEKDANKMTPAEKALAFRLLVRTGLVDGADEDSFVNDLDSQTSGALGN